MNRQTKSRRMHYNCAENLLFSFLFFVIFKAKDAFSALLLFNVYASILACIS